jgi:hypothetical protein
MTDLSIIRFVIISAKLSVQNNKQLQHKTYSPIHKRVTKTIFLV